ncbi:MAG: DUF58 domain-containing protein [Verrucomicrobia bacterium]|nr:DUF58 domain-containing protein [Verrucomicrobiota bacterium]
MYGSVSGIHKSATRGSSVEFAEYRKYAQGDDIRHVDWRVYARSDRFFMKEFEADTNLRCYLVLDTSGSMEFGSGQVNGSKFEFARRMIATLAYLLIHQGDAVGLLCFADGAVHDIPPRRTPSHLRNLFDVLGTVKPSGETKIPETIHRLAERVKQRALVIVFSDLFAEVPLLLDCFEHMKFKKHDLAVFHLLDRQEASFVFDRPIRFVDMENGATVTTDPSIMRETYLKEFDGYLHDLKHGCEEFGVDYRRVFTDSDYEKVLAALLLERLNKRAGKSL